MTGGLQTLVNRLRFGHPAGVHMVARPKREVNEMSDPQSPKFIAALKQAGSFRLFAAEPFYDCTYLCEDDANRMLARQGQRAVWPTASGLAVLEDIPKRPRVRLS